MTNQKTDVKFNRGSGWRSILVATLAMVGMALPFNNCSNEFRLKGSGVTDVSGLSSCDVERLNAFSTTVHPFVATNCASCHGASGSNSAKFANADIRRAYDAFALTGMEKWTSYALNPAHVNGITGPQNKTTTDAANEALNTANATDACKASGVTGPTGFEVLTVAKPISATATNRVIAWNLDTEVTTRLGEFSGATFEITVRQQTPTGGQPTYYILNPIVKTAGSAIEVKGIDIFVNGSRYLEGTTFSLIDRYIPIANTNTTLSAATMLKQMPAGVQPTDTIAIWFDHLKTTTAAPPTPTPVNGANLYTNRCASCHGALAASTKRGRTAAQITNAINTVGAMNNATLRALTTAEIQAIATALQ